MHGNLATHAGLTLISLYALWVFYLAIMNLKRAQETAPLNTAALVLGVPVLLVGYVLDCLVNWLVFSLVLLELPQELTVTARLSRHKRTGSGWRASLADWVCVQLLDRFDPGGCHCR